MRVIVPAVPGMLHPSVVPAIVAAGYRPEVHLVHGDDEAYWRLLRLCWQVGADSGVDLCIVEQDNEVPPGVLDGLSSCPEEWCACSYDTFWGDIREFYGPHAASLGCTRFSAGLMAAHPDLLDEIGQTDPDRFPLHHWANLDTNIFQFLYGVYRHEVHQHPRVVHHHPYVYEGAYVSTEVLARIPDGHPLKSLRFPA